MVKPEDATASKAENANKAEGATDPLMSDKNHMEKLSTSVKSEDTTSTAMSDPPSAAQRGAAKAQVTKSLGLLNISVVERDHKSVRSLLLVCRSAIDNCLRVCEAYSLADDPLKIELNEEYLSGILESYAMTVEKANIYLDSTKPQPQPKTPQPHPVPVPTPDPSMLQSKLEQMCDLLSMPETPLDIFRGDILQFNNWWTVYNERVGDKNVSFMVKLNKMLHAVQDEPFDLICFCKGLGGEEGYKMACEILLSTYDDPDAVCQAYTNNLKLGGKVTTPAEFLRLAADLRSASAILTRHKRISELQNQNVIKTIVMRLPS